MLRKVKFLGHEIGHNTIKPLPSKIEATKTTPLPKEKKHVMQFLGSVNFYSKFVGKLHVYLKPLYNISHDEVKTQWTPGLEKIFQNVKDAKTADTELAIPNTKDNPGSSVEKGNAPTYMADCVSSTHFLFRRELSPSESTIDINSMA